MQVFSEAMCRRLELLNNARRELVRMGYRIKDETLDSPAFEHPVTIIISPLTAEQSHLLLARCRGVRWRVTAWSDFRDVMFMGVRVVWEVIE